YSCSSAAMLLVSPPCDTSSARAAARKPPCDTTAIKARSCWIVMAGRLSGTTGRRAPAGSVHRRAGRLRGRLVLELAHQVAGGAHQQGGVHAHGHEQRAGLDVLPRQLD